MGVLRTSPRMIHVGVSKTSMRVRHVGVSRVSRAIITLRGWRRWLTTSTPHKRFIRRLMKMRTQTRKTLITRDAYHTAHEDSDSDEQDGTSDTESGADDDPMYDPFEALLLDHEEFWNERLSQDMGSEGSVRTLGEDEVCSQDLLDFEADFEYPQDTCALEDHDEYSQDEVDVCTYENYDNFEEDACYYEPF